MVKIYNIGTKIHEIECYAPQNTVCWRPDGVVFAIGNKDDKMTFYDFRMLMNSSNLKDNKPLFLN